MQLTRLIRPKHARMQAKRQAYKPVFDKLAGKKGAARKFSGQHAPPQTYREKQAFCTRMARTESAGLHQHVLGAVVWSGKQIKSKTSKTDKNEHKMHGHA